MPRNFPGRSGTVEDQVYLCSPETATASALSGMITDPRTMKMEYPRFEEPEREKVFTSLLFAPDRGEEPIELEKGPNIKPLPDFDPLPDTLTGPVLLKMGDDISTDEIMPAGAAVLPYRSNIPEISRFAFSRVDSDFYDRAFEHQREGFFVVGGNNYGQGSSREHAALAPRFLGLRAVVAKSFARIHAQNLVNFGILPLTLETADDWESIAQGDELIMNEIIGALQSGNPIPVRNTTRDSIHKATYQLSPRQIEIVLAGGLINWVRRRRK